MSGIGSATTWLKPAVSDYFLGFGKWSIVTFLIAELLIRSVYYVSKRCPAGVGFYKPSENL